MKRLVITLLLLAGVGTLNAQELSTTETATTLADAQIELDRAIAEQRSAVDEIRSEERRIVDAANERLESVREEYDSYRDRYRDLMSDYKQRMRNAKRELSIVAQARAAISRIRTEDDERSGRRR